MDLSPGAVRQFTPEEALIKIHTDSLSTHGFGIAELIALSRKLGILPEITIIGVQPEDTGYGDNLSPEIESAVETVCNKIMRALK